MLGFLTLLLVSLSPPDHAATTTPVISPVAFRSWLTRRPRVGSRSRPKSVGPPGVIVTSSSRASLTSGCRATSHRTPRNSAPGVYPAGDPLHLSQLAQDRGGERQSGSLPVPGNRPPRAGEAGRDRPQSRGLRRARIRPREPRVRRRSHPGLVPGTRAVRGDRGRGLRGG